MSIDFFVSPCAKEDGNCKKEGVKCKSVTNYVRFGISDRNSDKREPAFLDLNNEDIWDLVVENPDRKVIVFKAVDFCVEIFRCRNELIKRCEGFFYFDNKILFLELKSGEKGRWLIDAREKFEETIIKFKENYPANNFEILAPVVANRTFPRTHQNEMIQKRILKDKIGVEFSVIKDKLVL